MRLKPNVPMANQAAHILRRRLRQDYADGGRLPGENELAEELGVSRGTVRQALAILEHEGVIYRQQGSGTFANPNVLRIDLRVDTAYEFSELIESAGFDASIKTLDIKREPAQADVARRLNLQPHTMMLTDRKIFMADGQPAIYVIETVPVALAREPFEDTELAQPIFEFFAKRCHAPVDYIVSEIIPHSADTTTTELLKVPLGKALLQFIEVFYGAANEPLGLATIVYNDGYLRFHALRKMSRMP
jgi:GntR family transcriptional regulator